MSLKQIKEKLKELEKQKESVKQEKLIKEEDYKNNFHPKIKEFLNSEWDSIDLETTNDLYLLGKGLTEKIVLTKNNEDGMHGNEKIDKICLFITTEKYECEENDELKIVRLESNILNFDFDGKKGEVIISEKDQKEEFGFTFYELYENLKLVQSIENDIKKQRRKSLEFKI